MRSSTPPCFSCSKHGREKFWSLGIPFVACRRPVGVRHSRTSYPGTLELARLTGGSKVLAVFTTVSEGFHSAAGRNLGTVAKTGGRT